MSPGPESFHAIPQEPDEDADFPNSSEESSKRRDHLRKSLIGGIAASATGGVLAAHNERAVDPEKITPEHPNVVEVETENAYYKIVYNTHNQPIPAELADNADAIVMEGRTDVTHAEIPRTIETFKWESNSPYKKLIPKAKRDGIPIIFTDAPLSVPYEGGKQEVRSRDLKSGGEAFLAAICATIGIGEYIAKLDTSEEKMSRRRFLGRLALWGGSVYLITPQAEYLAEKLAHGDGTQEVDERSASRRAQRTLQEVNEHVHPETRLSETVDMRNTLIAQKTETVAEKMKEEVGRKPTMLICIGEKHTGLEQELQETPSKRIKTLQENHAEAFASPDIGLIARVDLTDPITARIFHDPALKRAD